MIDIFNLIQPHLQKLSVKAGIRVAGFMVILTYLLHRLSLIGWSEILNALPTSPLFYALSIGFVLLPVLAEILSFQTITHRRAFRHSRLFLRKHVVNRAVMNYAGDAYFIQKLAKLDGLGLRKAAIIMKDMALVRMFVANFWVIVMAGLTVLFGNLTVLQNIAAVSPALVVFVSLFCLGVCGGGLIMFRKLTRLPVDVAARVALTYFIRSVLISAILIAQWSYAIPGNSLSDWFILLLVYSVAKKSPVGGDLVFASVIVTLPSFGGDPATVAAMLIALAAVAQVLYFTVFLMTSETRAFRRFSTRTLRQT